MRLDIPTNQYNQALYEETVAEILRLPDIEEIGDRDDIELISVIASGRVCIQVIEIALRKGIIE